MYAFVRFMINLVCRLVLRIHMEGIENVPPQGAYVGVSNHIGRLDAALVFHLLDRKDIIMMVAEKYQKSAFWRLFVKSLDAVWVDRYHADLNAMRIVLRRIKQGQVLGMAPEGTRSVSGVLQPAHDGASYLAAKAGVPVVPVAIIGTWDPNVLAHLKRLRKVDVTIRVGKPFTLPPLQPGERETQLRAYTDEMMCRIAAMLPPAMRGAYAENPRLQQLLAQGEGAALS
jgi:1-acyl-sn-glycerol-3-phosphate acyltransferase